MRFWSKAWQDSFNVSELHHLFDARNKIMHSGHSAVSPDDSAKFAQVARHFVIATDALVKLSP